MPDNHDEKKIFGMTKSEWTEFKFIEHQLGVVDTKANNIITVDAVLIVISTLTSLFQKDINPIIEVLSTFATAGILLSVGFCIKTIWIKWATTSPSKERVMRLRDNKTKYLNSSLIILVLSLALYLLALIVGLLI